ncbi:EamA family transporter (plasmid) [Aggregatilineales bacterium SYSU G02658]
MDAALVAVAFGLTAAVSYGTSDFLGGFASKRSATLAVVFTSQLASLVLYALLALLTNDPLPSARDVAISAVSGVIGLIGLLALYRGLATQPMTLAAPISGVVAALIPVVFSVVTLGLPAWTTLLGFAAAFVAVWLVSGGASSQRIQLSALRLPFISGVGFGLLFILLSEATRTSTYYPLLALRVVSMVLVLGLARRAQVRLAVPRRDALLVVLTGLGDAGGNIFFVLAAQAGRLDIASVLTALYPAATVLLAALLLGERLQRAQQIGVGVGLVSIILLSV